MITIECKDGKLLIPKEMHFGRASIAFDESMLKQLVKEVEYKLTRIKELGYSIKNSSLVEAIASSAIEGYWTDKNVDELLCAEEHTDSETKIMSLMGAYNKYGGIKVIHESDIIDIAKTIEKEKVQGYRKYPVYVGTKTHITYMAPAPWKVRKLIDKLLSMRSTGNKLLDSIVWHYLFAYIHPFIDGNGRTARLVTNIIINDSYNIGSILPISEAIRKCSKPYYEAFKSVIKSSKEYNITLFIKVMLRYISKACDIVCVESGYKYEDNKIEADAFDIDCYDESDIGITGHELYECMMCGVVIRNMNNNKLSIIGSSITGGVAKWL